jgi:hypothetical protein
MIRAPHQNNFFFPFNGYSLVICAVTLTKIFLQTISIIRNKISQLEVQKHHFIFIIDLHSISTYLRPNIHQNSPEILGVNNPSISKLLILLQIINNHASVLDYIKSWKHSGPLQLLENSFLLFQDLHISQVMQNF